MMIQTEAMKEGIERKRTTIGTTPSKNGKSRDLLHYHRFCLCVRRSSRSVLLIVMTRTQALSDDFTG